MAIEPWRDSEALDAGSQSDGEQETAGGVTSHQPVEDPLQDTVMI